MKTTLPGAFLVVLSAAIGGIPWFTQCPGGSMKCHWTAHGAVLVAVPLLLVGLELVFARRREAQLGLAVLAVVLGALAVALPGVLFGVCGGSMACNTIMKPSLILSGSLAAAVGLTLAVVVALSRERRTTT